MVALIPDEVWKLIIDYSIDRSVSYPEIVYYQLKRVQRALQITSCVDRA